MWHRGEPAQGTTTTPTRRWAPPRLVLALATIVLLATVGLPAPPRPAGAGAPAPLLDCATWRYGPADEPATLPAEYDRDDYRRTSLRDPRPELADSPHNHCGQKGAALDLAWGLSRGRPDVVIAVLDSGIRWRDPGAMSDLTTQAAIDLAEAPPPCHPAVPDGDCNGDGRFDIADFGPIPDRNGNGLADPEDLILDPARNDGVDDDGDGYVDDISGWDFLHGDNNPFDTVGYGHGTGEALDSVAAENGARDVGGCPRCRFLPVRVSDSFIADGGRFAAGVLYGLDQGADVIQEALGALSNPPQAQQAIDAAWRAGVPVVASMADEASKHANLPAALERTLAVNSITTKEIDLLGGPNEGYLALNGCTNHGARTFVSVPSNACSSEATGQAAGMVALALSYAREVGVAPHPDLSGAPGDNPLSADEVLQLVRASADDVDFATPNAVDPANDFGIPTGNPIIDTVRYQTRPGWDAVHGYGRVNAYELLRLVRDGRIPPEASIDGPAWFDLLPASGTVAVTGRVAAVRARSYDYRVEWAPGLQPPAHPASDTWTVIGGAVGRTAPLDGTLATLDLAAVAAALPGGATGVPVGPDGRSDEDRFAVRLRVVVTAHGGGGDGMTGEMQKQVFVHDDPDLRAGAPRRVAGAGTAGAAFDDVDGDGADELVVGTDDGWIHAYRPDWSQPAGFPLRTDPSPWWPASPTAVAAGIARHHGGVALGGPAVGDLDGDGRPEVVATDLNGRAYVWGADGTRLATTAVDPAFSRDDPDAQDQFNRTKPGFLAAPALGDLDGDGDLEVVAAALDRHVYAWHHDGTPVAGFPVLVVDPTTISAVDPVTHRVTFAPGSGVRQGGELTATPALADLDGDGRPEIVVGAQEQYVGPPNIGDGAGAVGLLGLAGAAGNSRLYAIAPAGWTASVSPTSPVHPHAQAYLPGWPAAPAMATTNLLPTIGDGVAMPAAIGDVAPDRPGPEVVVTSAAGPVYVLGSDGVSIYGRTAAGDVPVRWTAELDLSLVGLFGSNRTSDDLVASLAGFGGPSLGDLDGDGVPDVTAPTAGLTRLIDLLAPDLQLPNDDQLSTWRGTTGDPLPGSPRATPDLAFFVAPAVADLDGDGSAESVAGNGLHTLEAVDAGGNTPAGWPKHTGGWLVGTPGVGRWGDEATLSVTAARRDGVLLVWRTGSTATPQWSQWGCDGHHDFACLAPAEPPPAPTTTGPPAEPPATGPPPSEAAAADTVTTTGALPSTGRSLAPLVAVAAILVAVGSALAAGGHRRRARRQLDI